MNRANVGNQVTNGMQILSVAGTTAASFHQMSKQRHLADASSALNNMTEDEVKAVGEMRADKLRNEVSRYNAKGESPYQHLSDEEAGAYQASVADDMRKKAYGDNEDIDELMGGTPFETMRSPQADAIRKYIENNLDFSRNYVRDGSRFRKMTREDLIKELKGGTDKDANS